MSAYLVGYCVGLALGCWFAVWVFGGISRILDKEGGLMHRIVFVSLFFALCSGCAGRSPAPYIPDPWSHEQIIRWQQSKFYF